MFFMLQIIRHILSDCSILYKNFLHWNMSKILIYITSFLLWLVLSLPFFVLLGICMYFDPIEWKDIIYNYYTTQTPGVSFWIALMSHYLYIIWEAFLFILWAWFFFFWLSYRVVLFAKLNLWYLKWDVLAYLKNHYFHIKTIWKYLWVMSYVALVFLTLFLIFVLLLVVYVFTLWGVDQIYSMLYGGGINMFSILSLWTFLMLFLVFIYLAYRMNYSYIIMVDEDRYKDSQKAIFYVKESFRITTWVKVFKFLLVVILFSIVLLPFDIIGEYLSDIESNWAFIYYIFTFLCITGLFEMFLVSTYKHIMLPKINQGTVVVDEEEIVTTQEIL